VTLTAGSGCGDDVAAADVEVRAPARRVYLPFIVKNGEE
jgi:hypothetical protein